MWFSLTILCVTLIAAWGDDNRVALYISPEHVKEMQKQAKVCGEEHGVDPKELKKMLDWTLPSDNAHKKFLYCICINAGFIVSDGHFVIDKMLEFDTINGTKEDFRNNLQECNKITLDNYLDTTYEMGVCLHKYHITSIKS